MAGESAPDLVTCGMCESLIFKSEKSHPNSNDDSDIETEEESEPLSIISMITTVFQYPFNQMTANHRIENMLTSQRPFVTCVSCCDSVKDFHSRFLELRDLIRETSRLSSVLNQWGELIVHAAGINMYDKEADSSQDQGMVLKSEINPHQGQDHENSGVPDEGQCLYFSCAVCDKVFSTKRNLSRHISSRHQEETETKSDSSLSSSSERGDIQVSDPESNEESENENKPSLRCSQCPKTFGELAVLKRHIGRSHSNVRLPCFQCGQVFKRSDGLGRHIKKVHGNEKHRKYMETLDEQMSSGYCPNTNMENCGTTTEGIAMRTIAGDGNPIQDSQQVSNNLADIASSVTQAVELLASTQEDLTVVETLGTKKSLKASERHPQKRLIARTSKATSNPQCRCTICDRKFPTVRYLTAHLSFRHGEELNSKAEKSFMSGDEDENDHYGCVQCPKTYSRGVLLTKHLRSHSTVKFRCSECDKLFTRPDHLKRHKRRIHKIEQPRRHQQREIVYQPVVAVDDTSSLAHGCPTGMQNRFPSPPPPPRKNDLLLEGVPSATSAGQVGADEETVELLTSADEDFASDKLANAKVEAQTHAQKDTYPKLQCRCTICDQIFPMTKNLVTHISTEHQDKEKVKRRGRSIIESDEEDENDKLYYGCAQCPKKFPSSALLNKHFRCHSTVKFACSVCGKLFTRPDHLKKHKRNVHETVKEVKPRKPREKKEEATATDKKTKVRVCPDCGKSFHRKDFFEIHMRIHTDERPYQCAECGKTFRSKQTLHKHSIRHKPEEDRPSFCCSDCGKVFSRAETLRYHEMTHKGTFEKKFICSFPECGKAFRQGKHLRSHELVHKPTKDYSCSNCGALFKWERNLRHHMVKTHGKQ